MTGIFDFLQPAFMKNALWALLAFAPLSALIGTHIVSLRQSFFSDAVAHTAFTGAAFGLLIGGDPLGATSLFAAVLALTVWRLEDAKRLPMDGLLSTVSSMGIAAGLCLLSRNPAQAKLLPAILYGDILSVSPSDLYLLGALTAAALIFNIFFGNRLVLSSLSRDLSEVNTRGDKMVRALFAVLAALSVALGLRLAGALLVSPMLVMPAIAARLAARSYVAAFYLTCVIAGLSSILSLAAAWHLRIPAAAGMVVVLGIFFFAAYFISFKRKA